MYKKTAIFLSFLYFVPVWAEDFFTENVIGGCRTNILSPINDVTHFVAKFERNQYTCNSGYYVPKNHDGCTTCLSGYTCLGGTYAFNENIDQGISYTFPVVENVTNGCNVDLIADDFLYAQFTPNEHTCPIGQYMPANYDGCVACLADSYCAGGTYTFNETVTQGIESCPNNWYSPAGSSSVAQCGRILHVGDSVVYLRSVKQTTPSLNVQIGDDIFYGNMATADVPMNINTERKLKVSYDDTTYSVYDDTVTIPE